MPAAGTLVASGLATGATAQEIVAIALASVGQEWTDDGCAAFTWGVANLAGVPFFDTRNMTFGDNPLTPLDDAYVVPHSWNNNVAGDGWSVVPLANYSATTIASNLQAGDIVRVYRSGNTSEASFVGSQVAAHSFVVVSVSGSNIQVVDNWTGEISQHSWTSIVSSFASAGSFQYAVISRLDSAYVQANLPNTVQGWGLGDWSNVTPSQPNILIDDLTVTNATVVEDTGLSLETFVRNAGGTATGAFTTRLYLSANSTVDASDWILTSFSTTNLTAGQSTSFGQSVPLPANATPGQYYLIVWADYNDAVSESNNNDNSYAIPITITAATPTAPEIAVTGNGVNIVDGDATPSTGDHTNFGSMTLGGAPITRVFTVTNTGNATLTLSGLSLPSGFSVVNGLVSSLAPGASDTFTVQLNGTSVGTWQGNISFTNNDSNENLFNFEISGTVTAATGQPDLYITTISGLPSSLQAGQSASLFYTIGNSGAVSAPASVLGIYLSTDTVITTSDLLVGTSAVGAIAVNTALANISADFTLPSNLAAGTYYVGVIADHGANIAESSETNNVSNALSLVVTAASSGDAGNTFETAMPVASDNWNGTVGVGADTADFYVLQAATTGVITLTLSGLEADIDLFFYDANENLLDSSANGGTSNDQVVANVVAGQSYYVALVPFNGATSTYDVAYTIAAAPAANASTDFSGDNVSDFFLRSASTGAMVMWFNASSANAAGLGAVATNWATNGFGDFNGDGRDDILWRNSVTGDMAMWFMNGHAVSGSAGFGVGTSWSISGIGDVNGDNRDDIVWRNANGDLILWFMNGAAISGAGLGNVSTAWQIEVLGDFNGDGRDDFIWRNSSTGDMSMWLMNGASAAPSAFANVGAPWNIAGVGDLNGDGRDDVIWRNSSTGAVSLWFMNGGTISSSTGFAIGAAWNVATIGDYNGDGRDDIIWRNSVSNDVIAWYMNGAAVQGSAFLGNLGSDWIINPGG